MFFSHSFRRSDFTYGVTKDQNVEMFFDKGDFRRSDFTYGVTKDQNVEILFSEFFLVFDVLIFVVLTISLENYLIENVDRKDLVTWLKVFAQGANIRTFMLKHIFNQSIFDQMITKQIPLEPKA